MSDIDIRKIFMQLYSCLSIHSQMHLQSQIQRKTKHSRVHLNFVATWNKSIVFVLKEFVPGTHRASNMQMHDCTGSFKLLVRKFVEKVKKD